jgi:hypothetical protein
MAYRRSCRFQWRRSSGYRLGTYFRRSSDLAVRKRRLFFHHHFFPPSPLSGTSQITKVRLSPQAAAQGDRQAAYFAACCLIGIGLLRTSPDCGSVSAFDGTFGPFEVCQSPCSCWTGHPAASKNR